AGAFRKHAGVGWGGSEIAPQPPSAAVSTSTVPAVTGRRTAVPFSRAVRPDRARIDLIVSGLVVIDLVVSGLIGGPPSARVRRARRGPAGRGGRGRWRGPPARAPSLRTRTARTGWGRPRRAGC